VESKTSISLNCLLWQWRLETTTFCISPFFAFCKVALWILKLCNWVEIRRSQFTGEHSQFCNIHIFYPHWPSNSKVKKGSYFWSSFATIWLFGCQSVPSGSVPNVIVCRSLEHCSLWGAHRGYIHGGFACNFFVFWTLSQGTNFAQLLDVICNWANLWGGCA